MRKDSYPVDIAAPMEPLDSVPVHNNKSKRSTSSSQAETEEKQRMTILNFINPLFYVIAFTRFLQGIFSRKDKHETLMEKPDLEAGTAKNTNFKSGSTEGKNDGDGPHSQSQIEKQNDTDGHKRHQYGSSSEHAQAAIDVKQNQSSDFKRLDSPQIKMQTEAQGQGSRDSFVLDLNFDSTEIGKIVIPEVGNMKIEEIKAKPNDAQVSMEAAGSMPTNMATTTAMALKAESSKNAASIPETSKVVLQGEKKTEDFTAEPTNHMADNIGTVGKKNSLGISFPENNKTDGLKQLLSKGNSGLNSPLEKQPVISVKPSFSTASSANPVQTSGINELQSAGKVAKGVKATPNSAQAAPPVSLAQASAMADPIKQSKQEYETVPTRKPSKQSVEQKKEQKMDTVSQTKDTPTSEPTKGKVDVEAIDQTKTMAKDTSGDKDQGKVQKSEQTGTTKAESSQKLVNAEPKNNDTKSTPKENAPGSPLLLETENGKSESEQDVHVKQSGNSNDSNTKSNNGSAKKKNKKKNRKSKAK